MLTHGVLECVQMCLKYYKSVAEKVLKKAFILAL